METGTWQFGGTRGEAEASPGWVTLFRKHRERAGFSARKACRPEHSARTQDLASARKPVQQSLLPAVVQDKYESHVRIAWVTADPQWPQKSHSSVVPKPG